MILKKSIIEKMNIVKSGFMDKIKIKRQENIFGEIKGKKGKLK